MHLSSLLTDGDFASTELSALRLDGEVFAVGDGFVCSDSDDDPSMRIRAVSALLGRPRIAARRTACWIYGEDIACPRPVEVVVPAGKSQSTEALRGVRLRESLLADGEVVDLAGLLVTSPLRTVADLLREPAWSRTDARAVSGLMSRQDLSLERVAAALADRRFQRERVRALTRLSELPRPVTESGQPAETR